MKKNGSTEAAACDPRELPIRCDIDYDMIMILILCFVDWAFKNKSTVSPACRKRRLIGGWRQDLYSGRQLQLIAKRPPNTDKKLLRGCTSDDATRRRAARRMKMLRQSRWDP